MLCRAHALTPVPARGGQAATASPRLAAGHRHARLHSRAARQWRSGSVRCALQRTASPRPVARHLGCAHALTPVPARGSQAVTASPRPAAGHRHARLCSRAACQWRSGSVRCAWQRTARPRTSMLGRAHACARTWQSGSNGKSSPSRGASPCSTALTSGAPVAFRQCALRVTAHCKPSPGCEASLCLAAHSRGTPVPARGSQAVTASPRPVTRHLHA
jgi:hypothetical protein